MTNTLSSSEKHRLAGLLAGSTNQSFTVDAVRDIVGDARDVDTTDILNGMVGILGYAETLRILKPSTINDAITSARSTVTELLDSADYSENPATLTRAMLLRSARPYLLINN